MTALNVVELCIELTRLVSLMSALRVGLLVTLSLTACRVDMTGITDDCTESWENLPTVDMTCVTAACTESWVTSNSVLDCLQS